MRVSVVIPAYNAAQTLAETLDSVRRQTHRDLEMFVVDDGSTDDTAAVAERAVSADARLRLIRQSNSGVAASRNAGLRRATGDFVAWLDADDLWHHTKIEKQLKVFEAAQEPLSFVYTGYRLIDEDGRVRRNFRRLVDVSGRTFLRQLATHHFSNASSIMVPRALALRFGGHDPRLRNWGVEGAEDMLLQLRLSAAGPTGCCAEALVGYRMHHRNMSLDYRRAAQSNLRALSLVGEAVRDIPRWVWKLGRARTVGYALHMARDGDIVGSARLLGQLAGQQPGYTLLTLALMGRTQLRSMFDPKRAADPEIGASFLDADPLTAPWSGHMALTKRHLRRLIALDAARAARAPSSRDAGAAPDAARQASGRS
jgi:glycosyltransferase involved in cell wall biosynthesis